MTDWMLRCESGPLAGKLFPLNERTVIGRALSCDISIPEGGLSREHAEMLVESNQLIVRDLESSNGTFLNGDRLAESRPSHGDTLTFDNMRFRVIGPSNDMDRTIISMAPLVRPAGSDVPRPATVTSSAPPPMRPAAAAAAPRAAARSATPTAKGVPAWLALTVIAVVVMTIVLVFLPT